MIKSGQKPLKYWAEGGLIMCADPNKPDSKPSYGHPQEVLLRVAQALKLFLRDMEKNPKDYHVTKTVIWNFLNEFRTKVYDVACLQDEQGGGLIRKTDKELKEAKKEWRKEMAIEAEKQKELAKKSQIFINPAHFENKLAREAAEEAGVVKTVIKSTDTKPVKKASRKKAAKNKLILKSS